MRRLIAVTTVLATLGIGASSAQAGGDAFAQAQRLCNRQGGGLSYETGIFGWYFCQGGAPFTERQTTQAYRLCTRNGGVYSFITSSSYRCDFPF